MKKLLVFGHSGKLGNAICRVFSDQYQVIGKSSADFDAGDPSAAEAVLREIQPDVVINTVAFMGIDPCEQDPGQAQQVNTLFPKQLAELSNNLDFLLVQISTDAVFDGGRTAPYTESDIPLPVNIYGMSKFAGECFVRSISKRHYVFRISVLFGETLKQNGFVEKMIGLVRGGAETLRVADDIILTPSYTVDLAQAIKARIAEQLPYGLYHLANDGHASLYELTRVIFAHLNLPIQLEKASHRDFPYVGKKNLHSILRSDTLPPLRPWQEAIRPYCKHLNAQLEKP